MSLILEIDASNCRRGCAWAWAVSGAYLMLFDALEEIGFRERAAGDIAHRMTHGGMFSGRATAERWIA